MKKYRKLFKNFFLAVLCIGLVSSIMSITTHAATDFYPDVSKLTTDWYYLENGYFKTRSYYGQSDASGRPYALGLNNYTAATGLVDGAGNSAYKFYGDNPWFTYLDQGTTALCNNSNDKDLTGYFWDGVGTCDNTLQLEFGVPSFVRDDTYDNRDACKNYHIVDGIITARPDADKTNYSWRLRSDTAFMNLVREKEGDDPTLKYIPHYFNDDDIFVIGLNLKHVGYTAYSKHPTFDGYVFVVAPSGTPDDGNIESGLYVLEDDPLTKEILIRTPSEDLNDTWAVPAALDSCLEEFKTPYSAEPWVGGPVQAWHPGEFVRFTCKTIQQPDKAHISLDITVNGKSFFYYNLPRYNSGSIFIGSISQPCATYKNIKLSGTVPAYTLHFGSGKKAGMSQTPSVSPTSKSISYGNTYGDLATASCLGYKTTASTAANWYYDSTNTITSSGTLRQFSDVYVEPRWEPIKYTVKYTAPKPSNASTNVRGTTAQTNATYDTSFNLPGTGYTLTGYHCNSGWLNENNRPVASSASNLTTIDGATVTLHHTWAPNPYKVQFNSTKPSYAVDVTGATSAYTQDFVYDAAQSLTTNQFSYTGATFVGWATTPNGTKSYANEESVTNLTNTKDAVVNLYALWKPAEYYVRYNRNLHDASGPNSKVVGVFKYGQSYTALTQNATGMSRDGYYIAYWTTNADGTGTRYYAGDKDWPAGENSVEAEFKNLTSVGGATVDLYAHWEPIKYVLVYNKNDSTGGTNPAGETRDSYAEMHYYNEEIALKANRWTRENELNVPSVFRGWNLLSDLNSTDKSVKYKARWNDTGTFVNGDSNKLCLERDSSITIYTVWDDAPVVTATDYELPYNDVTGYDSVSNLANSDSQEGLVLSKTRLEEILLANAVNKHGDREDGELPAGKNFRIEYFYRPSYSTVDHPTCYEVKYTVEDNTGNTYTQSAMLYAGYLVRIDVQ